MPDGDDFRRTLDFAIAEASSAGSESVEPLHLLIGVLRLGDDAVDHAVNACGIDPVRLRRHLRGYARKTVRPTGGGPLRISHRAERVLERARGNSGQPRAAEIARALLDPIDSGIAGGLGVESIDAGVLARALAPELGLPKERAAASTGRSSGRRVRIGVAELDTALRGRVVGQDHAVSVIAGVVAPALAGAVRPGRARAALLLVGAGDVGRSSVARALAAHLHGDPRRLVRVRAAEPHWEPTLAASIAALPRSIVYVDDLETLAPDDRVPFGRMLASGHVHRDSGAMVPLEDTIIFIGTSVGCSEGGSLSPGDVRRRLVDELGSELVEAVDRIVLFQQLAVDDIREIAAQWLNEVASQVGLRDGIEVDILPEAIDGLAEIGIRPEEGPCAMRRVVDLSIARPLTDAIESGTLRRGDRVRIVDGPSGPMLADALPGGAAR